MIKLVKGDINKLEGRVISYCKFTGDIRDLMSEEKKELFEEAVKRGMVESIPDSIIACTFYGNTSSTEFLEKMKKFEDITDESDEILNNSKKEIDGNQVIPFFITQIPNIPEDEMLNSKEDVIYAGSFSNQYLCPDVTMMSLGFYHMRFSDQLMRNRTKDKKKIESLEEKNRPELNINYKQIPPSELPEFIYKNYIIQMMNAKRDNRRDKYKTLEDQFISFGKGSHFQNDIIDICKFISSSSGDIKDTPIITATINKIQAINTEDFKAAAKYRDEVNLLRRQWQKGK